MKHMHNHLSFAPWTPLQRVLFRFSALFLLLFILPLDWHFYQLLFSVHWFNPHFYDLLQIIRYQPTFFPAFYNWLLLGLIAVAGTVLWSLLDQDRKEYVRYHYWLSLIVRYRLALTLFIYGLYKLFQLQLPYPPLSDLITNYGDFFPWKIYYQTMAISPLYQSVLGAIEILTAILLFNRKTVTFGAGLAIGFLINIVAVNVFYDVKETSFVLFLVVSAIFLFVRDIPRLYSLLIKEHFAVANRFIPRYHFYSMRVPVIIVLLGATLVAYRDSINGSYKLPKTPGLTDAFGLYDVEEFILNGDTIPYNLTDSRRWHNVVFEKWSTISIRVNRPVKIDKTAGEVFQKNDIDRNYELAGQVGRHFFHYQIDTQGKCLSLQNKNPRQRNEHLSLRYDRPDDKTLILEGLNEKQDSIKVVLKRNDGKHLMYDGRRHPIAL